MYGKVFTSIWDGSLYGHLEATATLMALVTLCNAEGVVDMTPEAISGRTGWPLDFIKKGIAELEAPDERSRTDSNEGRRLVRMSEHRDWGWLILNYKKYREKKDLDVERDQTRERVRRFRERHASPNDVTDGNAAVTPDNGSKRQAEAEAEAEAIRDREQPSAATTQNGHARGREGKQPAAPKKTQGQKTTIPDDFCLTDDLRQKALARYPDCDPDRMFEQFRAHHESHGKAMKSWSAAWTTWLGNAERFGYPRRAESARSGVGPRLLA